MASKKVKIKELADEFGASPDAMYSLVVTLGIDAKSKAVSIEEAQADRVRRHVKKNGLPEPKEEPAKPAKKAAAKKAATKKDDDGAEKPAKKAPAKKAAAKKAPAKKAASTVTDEDAAPEVVVAPAPEVVTPAPAPEVVAPAPEAPAPAAETTVDTPPAPPAPAPPAPAQPTPARGAARASAPAARREATSADDLNAMVLRLQSGAAPQTETERRLADRMGIAYRKGGLVAPKKYQEGGAVKVPGKTPAMGGSKLPARMRDRVSAEERKELDAPLTKAEKDRMAASGFKKGGKIVAKKMKTGGKVPAPKKMMKGGITSKPKAKPAKYAKGGMTKGCK